MDNFLEMIEKIQEETPEKEAFRSRKEVLSYRELYQRAKSRQREILAEEPDKRHFRIIRRDTILGQLTDFLACQGTNLVPVIMPEESLIPEKLLAQIPPAEACVAVMTSGSTGECKLLLRTFSSWYGMFPIQNEVFDIDGESRLFMQGSLAFTGNLNLYIAQLSAGAAILAEDVFDPRLWLSELKEWKANGIYLLPAKLRLLCDTAERRGAKTGAFPDIRTILGGSQSLGREDAARLHTWFPHARITLYYGATESNYVTYLYDTEMGEDKTRIGRPFPGVRVRCDEAGRIRITTPYGILGFPEDAFIGDGGHVDEEGFFCFDGRMDDICSVNGRKVSMFRVESALSDLEPVEEAAVKTVQKNGREMLAAWVVLKGKSGADAETIRGFLNTRLASWEIPKLFYFQDHLPKNESGKISKKELQIPEGDS